MRPSFDRFLTKLSPSSRQPRQTKRSLRDRRLKLELLEDRLALSNVPVTNGLDSGAGFLRAAIAAASSGDTIVFAPSVHSISLTSGDLAISTNLDIKGPGADKLTINGNNASVASASRVFDISGSATVTISGLTVANGEAVVTQPLGADGGGGILNEAGSTLTLNHCVLVNNEAIASPSLAHNSLYGDVCGGGLLNEGTAFLNATTVNGNQALGGGSYTPPLGGSTGGGIDNWCGATLTVSNSTITNNEAITLADPVGATFPYFALGGGIANHTGEATGTGASGNTVTYGNDNPSTVTIANSTVSNNEATGGTGVYINGGGILNTNGTFALPYNLAVMTVSNSTLSGNRAVGGENGSGPEEFSAADGGGIENSDGIITIDNSTLRDNQAIGGNGSTPTVGNPADFDVVAAPATGSGQGGGMVNLGGIATVSNSKLIDNKAIGGNTTNAGPGAIADGGAISNWGSALTEFGVPEVPGILTLTNSTLIGNEAIAGHGSGPASSTALWGFAAGGGIDVGFSGNATVTNCALIGNQAIGSSGANGGTGFGGGISLGFSYFFNTSGAPVVDNATLQLTNSTLLGNVARGGDGQAAGTGGDGLGGGLAINPGSSASVTNSHIDFNLALGGSGGTGGQGIGGGVYNDGTFTIDRLKAIDFNFASYSNDNIFG